MPAPDPGQQQNWLVAAALLIVGGVASAVTSIVNGILRRKNTKAESDKTAAEALKTIADAQGIKITADVNLSDAALRMVGGLRAEFDRVLASHKQEIAEVRALHAEEIRLIHETHDKQMSVMRKALDDSEKDRIFFKERCENLEKRINELSAVSPLNLTPLPEGGYSDEI